MASRIDPSGVSETAIVLPKGGGAVTGIGETFAPDPQSGSYQVSVPVDVPHGRRGAAPQLTLAYSSGLGNGPFGLGWTLSLPRITRSTRKGIPSYDETDAFLLDGEDLICLGPWTNVGTTRAERPYRMSGDRAFHRVLRVRDALGEWWTVTGPDGATTILGQDVNSRVQGLTQGSESTTAPQVSAWLTTTTSDSLGNSVQYRYKTDGTHRQVYLSRVDYVDEPDGRWLYGLVLDYGEYDDDGSEVSPWAERPDAFSEFRSGFEVRTVRRCQRIFVTLNEPTGSQIITRYDLTYSLSSGNAVSLLRTVTRVGIDLGESQSHAPMEFDYDDWQPGDGTVERIKGPVPRGGIGPGIELLDGEGFALAGVVVTGEADSRYWMNDGHGGLHERGQSGPPGTSLAHSDVWLVDLTGDGYADLGNFGDEPGFFAAIPGKGWATRKTPLATKSGRSPINARTDNGRLVDVDGDGRIDVLRVVSGEFSVHHNGGTTEGWGEPQRAPIPTDAGSVSFADQFTTLADLSGDGPIDLVRFRPLVTPPVGSCSLDVWYWPHLGHGRFANQARMLHLPLLIDDPYSVDDDPFAFGLDPERLKLVDVDGDGYDDVVYLRREDAIVWINQSGNRFSVPVRIPFSSEGPTDEETASVRTVDWYARGSADLMWSTRVADDPMRLVRLTGGGKPYLLTRVRDHRGTTATISYRSAAHFARADEDAGQIWRTRLPFPVHVVDKVILHEEFSRTTTTTRLTYHEGVWDGVEREFRGFARVEQDDAEVTDPTGHTDGLISPPVRVVSWFHVGAVGGTDSADELDLAKGYWTYRSGEPTPSEAGPLIVTSQEWDAWLRGTPPTVRRRALRALRGKPARVEEYLVDELNGHDGHPRPYSVTEYGYELRPEFDARAESDWQASPVFAVLNRGRRISQWERGAEPMTRATYDMRHDSHGRARLRANIAVPRGRDPYRNSPTTEPYLVEVAELTYATQGPEEPANLLDRVAAEVRFEVPHSTDPLLNLVKRIESGDRTAWRIIGATVTYYDGPAYRGRAFGELGRYGLPTRLEELVLTTELLDEVFAGETVPPWLDESKGRWSETYPQEFQEMISRAGPHGGYAFRGISGVATGLFATRVARRFDVHSDSPGQGSDPWCDGDGHGLVVGLRDGVDLETVIDWDSHQLRPARTVLGDRLEQTAEYAYRTQRPVRVVDYNEHETRFTYTPAGLLRTVVHAGPPGSQTDETDDMPGLVYDYGLTEYDASHAPAWISTRTILRPGLVAEQREYSDGFDRLLQSRVLVSSPVAEDVGLLPYSQAQPAEVRIRQPGGPSHPLVRVAGWVSYDNKGRIISEYEPFFDVGWEYRAGPTSASLPKDVLCTVTTRDPRGVPLRITDPNGTQRRFIHGSPGRLDDPDNFAPSPWVSFEYDADDNARRTHPDADPAWHEHSDTPASVEVDAWGRVVGVTERNASKILTTRTKWDANDNVVEVVDALGRTCYSGTYDLLGRPWRESTLDGGTRVIVRDPLGDPVERRDARGAVTLDGYDPLHRPFRRWARDSLLAPMALVEAIVHGDDPGVPSDAKVRNLRGRIWRRYDPAGVTTVDLYDIYGNPAVRARRWLPSHRFVETEAQVGPAPIWPPNSPGDPKADDFILDKHEVIVEETRDRRGAVHELKISGTLIPECTVTYTRNSLDEVVAVSTRTGRQEQRPVVRRRLLNARGQLTVLESTSDLITRLLYDEHGTTLRRQHVEQNGVRLLYDALLEHSPTGLVLRLDEARAGLSFELHNRYSYDAFHRLKVASGAVTSLWPVDSTSPATSGSGTIEYTYDDVGNLLAQRQRASGRWENRTATLHSGTNRISSLEVQHNGQLKSRVDYPADAVGNVVGEGETGSFTWDFASRLKSVSSSTSDTTTSFFYVDDDRVCTADLTSRGLRRVAHFMDWITVILDHEVQAVEPEVDILITSDGSPKGEPLAWCQFVPGQGDMRVVSLISDYLGSVRAAVADNGLLVQASDFAPFGELLRRQGPEEGTKLPRQLGFARCEEWSGERLFILGRRAYAPWLGRFLGTESLEDLRKLGEKALRQVEDPTDPPSHRVPGWALSPYSYAANSPLSVRDHGGREAQTVPDCTTQMRQAGQVTGTGIGAGLGVLGAGLALAAGAVTGGLGALAVIGGALTGGAAGFGIGDVVGETRAPEVCPPSNQPASATGGAQAAEPSKAQGQNGAGAHDGKGAANGKVPGGEAGALPGRKDPVGPNGPYTKEGGAMLFGNYNDLYRDNKGDLVRVPRGTETPIPPPNSERKK